MENTLVSRSKKFDFILFFAAFLLILIGLSTIQSTIVAGGESNPILSQNLINVQILAAVSGLLIGTVIIFINYRFIEYAAIPLYIILVGMLTLVLFVGDVTRGSARWFDFGFFSFQPSSLGQVLFIVILAAFFNKIGDKINNWIYLLLSGLLLGIPFVLILLEPDLGSAIVLVAVWGGMLFTSPLKLSRILVLALIGSIMVPLGWYILAEYQRLRIITFLNPSSDPLGAGYNLIQSIIAVGSGGISGRGWGRGTQSHLQFLPEQHTDFIFFNEKKN